MEERGGHTEETVTSCPGAGCPAGPARASACVRSARTGPGGSAAPSLLDFTNKNFPNYKEADIYELIECGYLRCEFPKGHVRTYDDNWNFVGYITYKGHTYYRGRLKEYFKGIGQLGGWIALVKFVLELINNLPEILKVFST